MKVYTIMLVVMLVISLADGIVSLVEKHKKIKEAWSRFDIDEFLEEEGGI